MTGFLSSLGGGISEPLLKSGSPEMVARLTAIMPRATRESIEAFAGPIQAAMDAYSIDSPKRQAAFLAQIAHESDSLWWQASRYDVPSGEEYASGSAYEYRADLGNIEEGDGPKYKGRGLLQITGRANYKSVGQRINYPLEEKPELLLQPSVSAIAAADFWQSHGLNELSDSDSFTQITRVINGGTNGLQQRQAFLDAALQTFDGVSSNV